MTRSDSVAVAFHPSVFILEEMQARGWTRDDLAKAMMASNDDSWMLHRASIDLYCEAGPQRPEMRMGVEGARDLSRAFGVSKDYFLNLEAAWLRHVTEEAKP